MEIGDVERLIAVRDLRLAKRLNILRRGNDSAESIATRRSRHRPLRTDDRLPLHDGEQTLGGHGHGAPAHLELDLIPAEPDSLDEHDASALIEGHLRLDENGR